MYSRGGVEDGQVYTSKKNVTVLEGPRNPKIAGVEGAGHIAGQAKSLYEKLTIRMKNVATDGLTARLALYDKNDGPPKRISYSL